jgi:hypothetical protein
MGTSLASVIILAVLSVAFNHVLVSLTMSLVYRTEKECLYSRSASVLRRRLTF